MAEATTPRGLTGRDGDPVPIRWVCPAYIVIGREKIGCNEPLRHMQRYHNRRHRSVVGTPCPSCGGFDDHSDTCPNPELMSPRDLWLWWLNDGTYEIEGVDCG